MLITFVSTNNSCISGADIQAHVIRITSTTDHFAKFPWFLSMTYLQMPPFDAEFSSSSYTSIQKNYSSPWANVSKDYWLRLDFIQYFHPSTTKGLDDPPRKIHHSTQNLILHLTQVSRKFTQVVERMSARITS